jgi:hypothetical protein
MTTSWRHYESAFEEHLRRKGVPFVSVDEARKTLLPEGVDFQARVEHSADPSQTRIEAIKSFDYVVYGPPAGRGSGPGGAPGSNLLIEVKGRKLAAPRRQPAPIGAPARPPPAPRLESWVTLDDVESLLRWEKLFGAGFEAALVFVYWCDDIPPDGLFHEVVDFRDRWYTFRAVRVREYSAAMKTRSPRWRTVHLGTSDFDRLSHPLCP